MPPDIGYTPVGPTSSRRPAPPPGWPLSLSSPTACVPFFLASCFFFPRMMTSLLHRQNRFRRFRTAHSWISDAQRFSAPCGAQLDDSHCPFRRLPQAGLRPPAFRSQRVLECAGEPFDPRYLRVVSHHSHAPYFARQWAEAARHFHTHIQKAASGPCFVHALR